MSEAKSPIDTAPLPWTVGDELQDFAVLDAERRVVARVASRFYNHEDGCRKAKEMAVRIAKAVNNADRGPTADDVRCCFLQDVEYMHGEAHAHYPEVFYGDKIDLVEMAKALRALAKDPFVPLTPGARYLIAQGSFILAKQCGWKMPDQPPELDLEPPNEKGEER